MGNTCIPVVDSFRYLANQYNIVKFKNKIKLKKNMTYAEIDAIHDMRLNRNNKNNIWIIF